MATRDEKEAIEFAARDIAFIADNIRKQAQAVQQPFRGRLEMCAETLKAHAKTLGAMVE